MSSSSPVDPGSRGQPQSKETVGVQDLIDRLKTEGIQEGQQKAEALLADAKKQAARIVDAARTEADAIAKAAQEQAEQVRTNGTRALALASRDVSLRLKEQLQHEFRGWVGRLVREQLDEPEFLADVIREIASQAIALIDAGGAAGGAAGGDTQDADQPTKLRILTTEKGATSTEAFVRGQAAEMLRQGVCLQADRSLSHGFRMQIVDDAIEIDFSDEAVTAALMRFLAPKFRQPIGSLSGDA